MKIVRNLLVVMVLVAAAGCGINSVTRAELEALKVGDVITYRYQKGGKSWFYKDKITRLDPDKIYYNPGKSESTSGTDLRIQHYETSRELSMAREDLMKFETEQGDSRKVVIWIN